MNRTRRNFWPLDPRLTFLNHGSFGSCPMPVREFQREIQDRIECQPVQFFVRDLEGLLDAAREALAKFLGASPDNLVFVPNATAGINTVLRSLQFKPGDELLVTNHEYNACRNALDFVARRSRAKVVVAEIPFPIRSPRQATDAVLEKISARTRLVLLDHVTSQTGLVLPIAGIIARLNSLGIDTLIDGAHAPGMIPLNLRTLAATYYTGNCHKWICAPKGAGFLHVHPDRQKLVRPLSISHGANSKRSDRSRFLIEFGWTGTWDPSALLSVPKALKTIGSLLPGGWPALMRRNRQMALAARRPICKALQIPSPCPDEMIGSLASFPLPDSTSVKVPASPLYSDPLQDRIRKRFNIEVPIIPWPFPPKRLLRISAHLYNETEQYLALANGIQTLLRKDAGHREGATGIRKRQNH